MTEIRLKKQSELWQRLRAARKYAQKTQGQAAEALGLSRPAISLWESTGADIRTTPDPEQLMKLANLYGVSAQYLLDDSAPVDAIESGRGAIWTPSNPSPTANDALVRQSLAFWSAVRFQVIMEKPALSNCFDVPVDVGNEKLIVPFLHGTNLVHVGHPTATNYGLTREVGELLMLEKSLGHSYSKKLFRWEPTRAAGASANLDARFDIDIRSFSDLGEAAKALLSL